MNLLSETIEKMKNHGKTEMDVKWIGSKDGKCSTTWEGFKRIADFEYDEGFGGREIAADLVVVGKNWWLERHEYDGSEWWEFKTLPIMKEQNEIVSLKTDDLKWGNLSETNFLD